MMCRLADEFTGDVLEQVLQIDFLLIRGSEAGTSLLSDECHDRDVVELGVVKAVEKMDGARSRGRIAKAHLAGEFGVSRGHKGRHFLVTDLHVFHEILGFFQGHVEAADTVARIAINAFEPPFRQPVPDKFADIHTHGFSNSAAAGNQYPTRKRTDLSQRGTIKNVA